MAAMSEGEGDEKALRFYTACFDGNLDEVQRIVQGNPDLELNRVVHGGTAFAAAVQNSHLEVVTCRRRAEARRGQADTAHAPVYRTRLTGVPRQSGT